MKHETRFAKTVLVIEDDDGFRSSLLGMLQHAGYCAAGAASCQEALDYLRGRPAPAVILLNPVLPDRPGQEFRREQQRDPVLASVPVVVLSGSGEAGSPVDELGDVGYLQKPVEQEALLAAVERFASHPKPEVLVVEDEPAVLRMLGVALRHYGFNVRQASDSAEAVRLYEQHHETIDVVLLDVQMARGLDGPKTLAALQGIHSSVRAVFMSGNTGDYSGEDLLKRGAARVLQKPFPSILQLAQTLWELARPGPFA